jgi:hypothetical protein
MRAQLPLVAPAAQAMVVPAARAAPGRSLR